MSNKFLNDLPELIEGGIITNEIAESISIYYEKKKAEQGGVLQVVLAVLGAILIGLGILFILAHNWDYMSVSVKTILAFTPLVVAQALAVYIILKKSGDKMWQESVGVFLYISIAISISLVSHIYNISGELDSFMLIWMLLSLPIIYILDSSMVSLLYIGGITVFALNALSNVLNELYYFPLILLILPYYYYLVKNRKESNFTYFHNWIFPLFLTASMPILAKDHSEWMPVVFISLFGLFYILGKCKFLKYDNLVKNAYVPIGLIGTMVVLFIGSFEDTWTHLLSNDVFGLVSRGMIASIVFATISMILLVYKLWKDKFDFEPINIAFIVFFIVFVSYVFFGYDSFIPVIIINALILYTGIYYIKNGEKYNDLLTLNIGLLIIASLIIMRFFDYDITFLVKGIIFILLGIGFFIANYLLLKKRVA